MPVRELRLKPGRRQYGLRENEKNDDLLIRTLRMLAPGTTLHEALENILRSRTGALIVIGDSEQVLSLVNGGFRIDADTSAAGLYELAKMDGAIILSSDTHRILYANAHLTPNPVVPAVETGIRHRTAERVARQTGELVISISQRRNVITIYHGALRFILRDLGVILAKANQALATLERYKAVLQQVLANLSAVEFEDVATLYDAVTGIQRAQLVNRIASEIERFIVELGSEGRLANMQLEEMYTLIQDEGLLVIRDYMVENKRADEITALLEQWSDEELLDLSMIAKALGYANSSNLDTPVTPRGYRLLHKITRLPAGVIDNLVARFKSLPAVLDASIGELDTVEGIGEVRAKAIKDGLRRLREQVLLDRQI